MYTEVVPDCAKKTLQAIIHGKVDPDSVIHSDHWRGYNGLVDMGYKKHYRVRHGHDEFAMVEIILTGLNPSGLMQNVDLKSSTGFKIKI